MGMISAKLLRSSSFDSFDGTFRVPPLLLILSIVRVHFIGRECQLVLQRVQAVTMLRRAVVVVVAKRDLFSLLGLVSFQVFHPSPCTTCFMLLVMGLGLKFHAIGDGFRS
jgi:hypothetical protein